MPPPLAPFVASMVGYAGSGLAPGVHRGLPSGWLTMVFSLDRPLCTAPFPEAWSAGVRDRQWVVLGGLHTRAAMVEQPRSWAGVQLALHPLGARRLWGLPAAAMPVDQWDARDLLGTETDRVVEELHAAPDWPGRYAAVNGFLLRQLSRHAEGKPTRPEVAEAWRLLTCPTGQTPVGATAARVGYSRRRLTQLFAAEVGHGPKTVGRLARFDTTRHLLGGRAARQARLDLAELAAATGYYDQSHLAREFREFAGLGPSEWLAAEFPNLQATAGRGKAR